MKSLLKKHTHSFSYALEGMLWAFKEHKNYRIHAILSIVACIAGYVLILEPLEWIALVLTITLGFVIETINTALEATCDVVDTKWRRDIKIAKDVSAGAMLIYSCGAIIIATILFIPKIAMLY